MDKLTPRQNLIKQFMSEFAEIVNNSPMRRSEMMLIFDDEHKQYLLLKVGRWENDHRVHHPTLHVHLQNDKFWIEEDWTEDGFATYLLENGIGKEEIVLAFHPPEIRHLTDFAVA
jgi:hypothetical protein